MISRVWMGVRRRVLPTSSCLSQHQHQHRRVGAESARFSRHHSSHQTPSSGNESLPSSDRLIWRSVDGDDSDDGVVIAADANDSHPQQQQRHPHDPVAWHDDVASNPGDSDLSSLLERIEKQELQGGRMRTRQQGVLHEDPKIDMRLLTENYTVKSLASALRDREEVLQHCAQLAQNNDVEGLKAALDIFHPDLVLQQRKDIRRLDLSRTLTGTSLEIIRKALMRMPRRVTQAHSKRAGVVLAMCHVNGVPSLLFEKRAASLRAHPDEICLPGGMFCSVEDKTIVETCLREMGEEIGGLPFEQNTSGFSGVNVLGVLRCNWGNVHHLVGVAVTPLVVILQKDLGDLRLEPNKDEVSEVFTVPVHTLLDSSKWIHKEDHAPIFIGGPYAIWGLTGYILQRFMKDILLPHHVKLTNH